MPMAFALVFGEPQPAFVIDAPRRGREFGVGVR